MHAGIPRSEGGHWWTGHRKIGERTQTFRIVWRPWTFWRVETREVDPNRYAETGRYARAWAPVFLWQAWRRVRTGRMWRAKLPAVRVLKLPAARCLCGSSYTGIRCSCGASAESCDVGAPCPDHRTASGCFICTGANACPCMECVHDRLEERRRALGPRPVDMPLPGPGQKVSK